MLKFDNPEVIKSDADELAVDAMSRFGNAKEAISFIEGRTSAFNGPSPDAKASAIDLIRSGKVNYRPHGNIYKVDIPDEAIPRMLDWDKPLSQQAPEVRAVIDELTKTPPQSIQGAQRFDWISAMIDAAYMRPGVENQVGGQSLYNTIGGFLGQDAATDLLKSKGIPGIRYLDGGSRGAGTGTSNFVLFDDQLPRILERNGEPTGLQPWGPGEWGGL